MHGEAILLWQLCRGWLPLFSWQWQRCTKALWTQGMHHAQDPDVGIERRGSQQFLAITERLLHYGGRGGSRLSPSNEGRFGD
jgi:hypothetical protein